MKKIIENIEFYHLFISIIARLDMLFPSFDI